MESHHDFGKVKVPALALCRSWLDQHASYPPTFRDCALAWNGTSAPKDRDPAPRAFFLNFVARRAPRSAPPVLAEEDRGADPDRPGRIDGLAAIRYTSALMSADPALLASVPFFQTLDADERAALAALMGQDDFATGSTIFREGDHGGVLYILHSGQVELSVTDEQSEQVVLDVLQPGEFFGEMSLLDGGSRSTTARALSPTRAWSLHRKDFLAVLQRQPDAALNILGALAGRIRKTNSLLRRRLRNPNDVVLERETLGERVADGVARFGGSWYFIFAFGLVLCVWVLLNTKLVLLRRPNGEPFDPYPFILLNLLLSMIAALQAPVIMMSQNRQDHKDRIRSELDYQVNLKAELEIMQLHEKVDRLHSDLLCRLGTPASSAEKERPERP